MPEEHRSHPGRDTRVVQTPIIERERVHVVNGITDKALEEVGRPTSPSAGFGMRQPIVSVQLFLADVGEPTGKAAAEKIVEQIADHGPNVADIDFFLGLALAPGEGPGPVRVPFEVDAETPLGEIARARSRVDDDGEDSGRLQVPLGRSRPQAFLASGIASAADRVDEVVVAAGFMQCHEPRRLELALGAAERERMERDLEDAVAIRRCNPCRARASKPARSVAQVRQRNPSLRNRSRRRQAVHRSMIGSAPIARPLSRRPLLRLWLLAQRMPAAARLAAGGEADLGREAVERRQQRVQGRLRSRDLVEGFSARRIERLTARGERGEEPPDGGGGAGAGPSAPKSGRATSGEAAVRTWRAPNREAL